MQTLRNFFYDRLLITESDFQTGPDLKFGFQATSVMIVNDSDEETLGFSFRPDFLDGELFGCDGPWVADGLGEGRLWFRKSGIPDISVRVWAWRV